MSKFDAVRLSDGGYLFSDFKSYQICGKCGLHKKVWRKIIQNRELASWTPGKDFEFKADEYFIFYYLCDPCFET